MTLNIYEGVVDVTVPVTRNANWNSLPELRGRFGLPPLKEADLDIVVNYQACSETICYRPETLRLSVTVPTADLVYPTLER